MPEVEAVLVEFGDEPTPEVAPATLAEVSGGLRPRRDATGPVPRLAAGSDDHERVALDRAYFDDPDGLLVRTLAEKVDAHGKELVAIREELPALRKQGKLRRIGVPTLTGLGGAASAVLVYALAFARDQGDAAAVTRERAAERQWLVKSLREDVLPQLATLKAELQGIRESLRLYFPAGALRLQGPSRNPFDSGDP